jgi:hypothetical protein
MPLTDVTEGALVVSVPDDHYFRFEDCPTYASVSGFGLTEADVAWMRPGSDRLWLMELKDYGPQSRGVLAEGIQKLRDKLPKNIVHAALMVAAVWADTPFGQALRADIEQTFPCFPRQACPTSAALVVNLENPAVEKQSLLALQITIQKKLEVMGFEAVLVLPADDPRLQNPLGIRIRPASPPAQP